MRINTDLLATCFVAFIIISIMSLLQLSFYLDKQAAIQDALRKQANTGCTIEESK
jgi:hypothetical protein